MRFSVEREDLDRWCKQVLESDKLHTSRLSSVFKFQAFFFYSMGNRIDSIRKAVHDIDQEVIQSPGMKADTQFESLPLKGLWKKHVYDLAWEAVNLKSEFADEMSYFGVRLRKLFKEHEGQSFDSIRNEVIDLAINAMPNREKAGALTGEWIIYSRTNGNRLILTFAGHRGRRHP